ncbi:erythropoietin receptor [Megalops cyprinoides]|uniref:erythropoietin receptor n=1 Tax=Megalops cyprinoides TaxID=118141 RepID=UPI001863EC01|nr:erythropoietin receptor [Megalops cyprinoides]
MTKVESLKHWGFFVFLCFQKATFLQGARNLETKVALLLAVEPQDPKCFAEGMEDLTCFWEDDGILEEYTFMYTYQYEKTTDCVVTAQPTGGSKARYFCKLSKVQHFVPLDLHVYRGGQRIHNRSLFVEHVFLLDPPANLTVNWTGKQGQLRLSWLPPPLKYMDNSMIYEISYVIAGRQMGKLEVVQANTEITLRGLQPGTRYEVRARVKPDGVTYDGYWSAWTSLVSRETPQRDMDPLILTLCLVISFILILLSLSMLLSHRRFLLKKMWPLIPNPENKFEGLFTVYGGDFQAWLVHSSGGLWWRPGFFYVEELPAPLEVLSEGSLGPAVSSRTVPSRALAALGEEREDEQEGMGKADPALTDRWNPQPQGQWLFDQLWPLHQHSLPPFDSGPLESKDTYVTLNQGSQPEGGEGPLDDVSEESLPLQVLFATPGTPVSQSDLGSLRHSSGSGRLSSQSSFEYAHNTWPPKSSSYAYLAIADSGIYMDYSPMSSARTGVVGTGGIYTNEYENDIHPHKLPHPGQPIHSEC